MFNIMIIFPPYLKNYSNAGMDFHHFVPSLRNRAGST